MRNHVLRIKAVAIAAVLCLAASPALAQTTPAEGDPVTLKYLPGINVTGHIDAAATYLATIVAAVIGVWMVFRAVKFALRWAGRMAG